MSTTVKTESNGRIVKKGGDAAEKKKREPASLAALLQDPKMIQEIQRALPTHLTADRMLRIMITALRTTKDLAKCSTESFMGCVLQSAQLGLEVNTPLGHAYLIPRKNGKLSKQAGREVIECTLITGYQGMIELSMRSGKVLGINAQVVREGDYFEYELGLNPFLKHRHSGAADREQRPITYAYAVARIKDAEPVFEVLSAAQLEARAARSSSGETGPWTTDTEAMCRKTAVRALWKWIPKSSEMAAIDHIETTAELGSSQASAFSTEVQDALARQGLEPIDTTSDEDEGPASAEPSESAKPAAQAQGPAASETRTEDGRRIDPNTGELFAREPGQDG